MGIDEEIRKIVIAEVLVRFQPDRVRPSPAALAQSVTGTTFLPRSPSEDWSDRRPIRAPGVPDSQIPIDDLLGSYDNKRRVVTIYRRNVRDYAGVLECAADDLAFIVRLHEFGHAVDHLGVTDNPYAAVSLNPEDADSFFNKTLQNRQRRRFRHSVQTDREVWAQAIAWVALHALEPSEAQRMEKVFLDLMERQSDEYQIPATILSRLTTSSLKTARYFAHELEEQLRVKRMVSPIALTCLERSGVPNQGE